VAGRRRIVMNNEFVYTPKIESIEDLQPGDRFLVGDSGFRVSGAFDLGVCLTGTGLTVDQDRRLMVQFLKRNVPVERDIPCPEGYEMFRVDKTQYNESKPGCLLFNKGVWEPKIPETDLVPGWVYAIPKQIEDKQPKVYEVSLCNAVLLGNSFQPGDKVTVQKVEA
jgi:hypothetical protein